jgi:hypothetical protein
VDRDDIIKMAKEAGIEFYPSPTNDVRFCLFKNLERFAALVAAAEREACAQVVEAIDRNGAWVTKAEAAAAIRARSKP